MGKRDWFETLSRTNETEVTTMSSFVHDHYIGNSVQAIDPDANAAIMTVLLEKLKEIDENRIAAQDEIVLRKAVYGLLSVVSNLEGRIARLEQTNSDRQSL